DPPFSRMDLISCRNLLIYLNSMLQNYVVPALHYALKPGGFLFLGTSENITQHAQLFSPIDKKNRIFQRRGKRAFRPRLAAVAHPRRGRSAEAIGEARSVRQTVDARVLERFSPAHVVATRDGDVVNYAARTGKFLEPPPGRPSRALMTRARRGLRLPLRS